MDRLRRVRERNRRSIDRVIAELNQELAQLVINNPVLQQKLEGVEEALGFVETNDQEILDAMLDEDATDEETDIEMILIEEYKNKVRDIKYRVNEVMNPSPMLHRSRSGSPTNSEFSTALSASETRRKRNYKLPKIEIKKFNGEVTEWLGFWSQFEKIHKDEELHDSDKFQYLVQSMTSGTRAKKLVESYPQSAENYQKVIDALKDRFGDKVILTEVYVRKLLKMVVNNAVKQKDNSTLSSMYDELESNIRSLESLGVASDQSAAFLYPLVESSLPVDMIKVWQRSPISGYQDGSVEKPANERLQSLIKFLCTEVKGAERLSFVTSGLNDVQKGKKMDPRMKKSVEEVPTAAGLFSGEKTRCLFCDRGHQSDSCGKAQMMSIQDKKTAISNKKCCFYCLKPGHQSKQCKSFVKCMVCSKKHVTLMCPDLPCHQPRKEVKVEIGPDSGQTTVSNLACSSKVILKTLMVHVVNKNKSKWVRALIDDGSQRSYVLKKLADELSLTKVGNEDIVHALFTGVQTGVQRHTKHRIQIKRGNGNGVVVIEALDQEKICGRIPRVCNGPWLQELKSKIWISDIGGEEREIEILIGADYVGKLMTGNIHQLQNGLTAVETVLGWTLMGKLDEHDGGQSVAMTVTNMLVSDASVQQLWNLEVIGIRDPSEMKSKEEKEKLAQQHFLRTVNRDDDGRYSVRLPWISESIGIPDNKTIAEKRLVSATRKLAIENKVADYDELFKSWEDEGIIEELKDADNNQEVHYLPHRPVFKPESATTPIRPVFDASCKGYRSPSLNDCLEKGPNLMELIPAILLRFREKNVGITSDIRKAFLMVGVNEADRDFLRFLWWTDKSAQKMKIYRHRRVVFGVNCSPFLLAATIEHHLRQVKKEDREVATKLIKSLYVDNCVTSEDSIEECKSFMEKAVQLLSEAKMELRQWEFGSGEVSGVGQLASSWCGLETGRIQSQVQDTPNSTVLGIIWNKDKDTLSVEKVSSLLPEKITKRAILSCAQKVFDPIGMVCPALLLPKLLLQNLWLQKIGWDDEVSEDVGEKFKTWHQDLGFLHQIQVTRNFTGYTSERANWQVYTFCDASQDAYAAAVYLRTDNGGTISVQLLQAKARIAPLKKTSIPRLELLGCTIAARLTRSVMEALDMNDVPVYFWCDSTTALAWIRRNDDWGTFVGNRVKEIIKLTDVEAWRHVPGINNPADLPSRGCSPKHLLESKWWEGPTWLKSPEGIWPSSHEDDVDEDAVALEKKKSALTMTAVSTEIAWYARKSTYSGNVYVLAWVLRFVKNSRSKTRIREKQITFKEYGAAEVILIRLVQSDTIPSNLNTVSGIHVSKNNEGLICVKTKLVNRPDSYGFRYPVLLPNSHCIVDQLILEQHLANGHAGTQFLMSHIREKFWIIQGRRAIRKVIQRCVICRRFNSKKTEVPQAALPMNRVKSAKAFEVTGVDLAGPLFLKKKEKAWIVLFTCAIYRCVHLELVKSISTESFLAALSRFIGRRGRPTTIYSDNGTNFVGTFNAFKKLDWDKITKKCGLQRIEWRFNPPTAAWWGGWWERLIRSIKDLLRRILGKECLGYEKMETFLVEIESVINNRPLTTVTEDPNDLVPLTPAMFLHDLPNPMVKDLDLLDPCGFQQLLLGRKTIMDEFKMRFRKEYLGLLIQRGKEKKIAEFEVGDVVLIGFDNKRRWEWPMAKILELIPGNDGVVRVARVKTANGELFRPLQRLYNMEVSSVKAASIPSVINSAKNLDNEVRTKFGRLIKKPQRFLQQ